MSEYDPLDSNADPFKPPAISTLVGCIHCGEEYDSYRIEWRIDKDAKGKPHGFWCCPIPGCGGMGFGFDIFPVDRNYRDENGELMWCDDEEEEEDGFEDFEDERPSAEENGQRKKPPDDDEQIPY